MTTETTRRLYYDDSFVKNFEARVLSCEAIALNSVPHVTPPAWGIILDSTAFYPTSGGQPHDLGKLGEARVLAVLEEDGAILHIVDQCLPAGPVNGCIDWDRRFDHMQQHTGQHLLSALLQERFGLPTVSFHLGTEISTIDVQGPEPTEAVLEGAERAANQIISEDRPITVRYATPQQLVEMGIRRRVERDGILRVIEIEGADLQPCGGTHVKRTGEIGAMLLRRCSKVRQDWRIEFSCGMRAIKRARADFQLLRQAALHFACATEDVAQAASRAIEDRDAFHKRARSISERLAGAEAGISLNETPAEPGINRVIVRSIEGVELEYLLHFATQLAKSERTIALLSRVECGNVIFAQHPSAGKDMAQLLKQVFLEIPGKGGGTPDFARGKIADPARAQQVVDLGASLLRSARAAS